MAGADCVVFHWCRGSNEYRCTPLARSDFCRSVSRSRPVCFVAAPPDSHVKRASRWNGWRGAFPCWRLPGRASPARRRWLVPRFWTSPMSRWKIRTNGSSPSATRSAFWPVFPRARFWTRCSVARPCCPDCKASSMRGRSWGLRAHRLGPVRPHRQQPGRSRPVRRAVPPRRRRPICATTPDRPVQNVRSSPTASLSAC